VLAAALLVGPFVCPPAGAQSADDGQTAKPAWKVPRAKAAKSRTPAAAKSAQHPTGAKAPAPPQRPKLLDPAKVDPLDLSLEYSKIDPRKLNAKTPNAWIALGLLEGRSGNLAGAKESMDRAMALGEQRRNKGAVAAGALFLARVHATRFAFLDMETRNVAALGSRPGDDLTGPVRTEFDAARTLLEKALALHKALGRKDGMAADYARLGDLYSQTKDYDQAQAMLGEALALNKALQRKKEMAANYRALAETHRYDLDHAEALLKEAVALHQDLGLNTELAADYQHLAENNMTRGEPSEAERLYKQALALATKREQGSILRALERLYRDRNDPGQAADVKEQARALEKETEKNGGGRMILFNARLGLWVSLALAKEQLEGLEKAVPQEKSMGHWVGLATSYTLLGLHYGQRAEIDADRRAEFEGRAEAMFRESLALNATLKREDAMADAYRELALILNRRGKVAEVETTLKDAEALSKKLGDKGTDMRRLYSQLGFASKERGDAAQACAYWRNGALAYPDDKTLVDALNRNKCAGTQ
jgi:tetratricopeptide (TPR) repeat protein